MVIRSNLGIALKSEGKLDEAEHSHRYVYKKCRCVLSPHHREAVSSQPTVTITLNGRRHCAKVVATYREALVTC
jgi:hypothetical protein